MEKFSERLEKERTTHVISRDEMAAAMGITRNYYDKIANGGKKPSREALELLHENKPDVDVYYIMFGEKRPDMPVGFYAALRACKTADDYSQFMDEMTEFINKKTKQNNYD